MWGSRNELSGSSRAAAAAASAAQGGGGSAMPHPPLRAAAEPCRSRPVTQQTLRRRAGAPRRGTGGRRALGHPVAKVYLHPSPSLASSRSLCAELRTRMLYDARTHRHHRGATAGWESCCRATHHRSSDRKHGSGP
ncbi:unnamed protein product [Miscanthus lutarioriparius]|uniref:Uncharacterized protein n=1 Tax=Miscanthus lutarioriparius TaxID=422564 RepID=A0A811QAT3_9POAL|nr:unnamed protein product [Miscanthus lutarioriparius]